MLDVGFWPNRIPAGNRSCGAHTPLAYREAAWNDVGQPIRSRLFRRPLARERSPGFARRDPLDDRGAEPPRKAAAAKIGCPTCSQTSTSPKRISAPMTVIDAAGGHRQTTGG